jgi:hypothetical protein
MKLKLLIGLVFILLVGSFVIGESITGNLIVSKVADDDSDPDSVTALDLTGLTLCDSETRAVRSQATVCTSNGDKIVIDSVEFMNSKGEKPQANKKKITLLYFEPAEGESKKVRALLTTDILTNSPVSFAVGAFSENMIAGEGLILSLEGENYYLTHEEADLYDTSKLKLMHIPTKMEYEAVNYQGTAWYIFEVEGQRNIAVRLFGEQVQIQGYEGDEVPAGYVLPQKLNEVYEVVFTKSTPVEIKDPAEIGVLSICQSADSARDTEQVQICVNNLFAFTLQNGVLTNVQNFAPDPDAQSPSRNWLNEYTFIFEVVEGVKQVSLFKQVNLDENEFSDPATLETYKDFIDNMAEGRRLAVKFGEHTYLLGHPTQDLFSLPDITLSDHSELGLAQLPVAGSESVMQMHTLDNGKIFLKRNYGSPPPPFSIWALTQEELESVDMQKEFFTSFSSLVPVTLSNPAFGTIRKADDDTALYQPEFKILKGSDSHTLSFNEHDKSFISDNVLFYYHSADITGSVPVKSASIYLFYDLDDNTVDTHDFDDDFIQTFTGGNELSLGYGDSFYLLGHEGTEGETQFYSPSKLTLRTLDGSETFNVIVENNVASFDVPEGRILVQEDNTLKVIEFKKATDADFVLLEGNVVEFEDYTEVLTTSNAIRVEGITFRMCFKRAYADLQHAKVCSDDGSLEYLINPTTIIELNDNEYILESNQQTGNAKTVTIRKIIPINEKKSYPESGDMYWFEFIDGLSEEKPLFNVSGDLYLPSAGDSQLHTFGFVAYPDGRSIGPAKTPEEITPISFKAPFILEDKIVFVEQEETGNEEKPVKVSFSMMSYLPDSASEKLPILFLNSEFRLNATEGKMAESFVTTLDAGVFEYSMTSISSELAELKVEDLLEGTVLKRYFSEGDSRRLNLDNVIVEITVVEIDDNLNPTTIIKRIQ